MALDESRHYFFFLFDIDLIFLTISSLFLVPILFLLNSINYIHCVPFFSCDKYHFSVYLLLFVCVCASSPTFCFTFFSCCFHIFSLFNVDFIHFLSMNTLNRVKYFRPAILFMLFIFFLSFLFISFFFSFSFYLVHCSAMFIRSFVTRLPFHLVCHQS